MPYTRGYMLRFDLAFALGRLKIRNLKGLLTEENRYAIADEVVRQLRQYPGDPWKLDEEIPTPEGVGEVNR